MSDHSHTKPKLADIAGPRADALKRNLTTPRLVEEIVRNREGHLAHLGAVVVRTAHQADCTPLDRYLVDVPGPAPLSLDEPLQPMAAERFAGLWQRLLAYTRNRELYLQDGWAGSDPARRVALRVIAETAWHGLVARNLFQPLAADDSATGFEPDFTLLQLPGFPAIPERDGTRSTAFVVVHPAERLVIIGGTAYAGELRQAAATMIRDRLNDPGLLPLRCAVNLGPAGDAAAFLGRTGNGKTALALDPQRRLLGDHLHAWTADGLVSFLRGGYAKVLGLEPAGQPLLWAATRRFGCVLENVGLDPADRRVDFSDDGLGGNLRACFPLSHIDGASGEGACGHPANVFLLTRDTTGVLPPIARLDADQAAFALLTASASARFETETRPGDVQPVLPDREGGLPGTTAARLVAPHELAKRFLERIARHGTRCWFMNTGWVGEPQGRTGRIELAVSRALVRAAIAGELDRADYQVDPLFGFRIPTECPGLSPEQLDPRAQAADEGDYEVRANQLAAAFIQGFERYGGEMPESVRQMVANVVLYEDTLDVMDRFRLSF